jgi:hypothetical protein
LSAAVIEVCAVGLGVVLWALLLAIRGVATRRRQRRLGSLPMTVSLVGHVIYGGVLAAVVLELGHR